MWRWLESVLLFVSASMQGVFQAAHFVTDPLMLGEGASMGGGSVSTVVRAAGTIGDEAQRAAADENRTSSGFMRRPRVASTAPAGGCAGEGCRTPATSTGLSICPQSVAMDPSSSVWSVANSSQSCYSEKGIRSDVGFACAGAEGMAADPTSIFVDMGSTEDKAGCFVWETADCQYPMHSVRQIDFDVEWEGCDRLWMAPLWTFSEPWAPLTGKQGLSGEIDFVEECEVPTVNTNLGCYDADQGSGCVDAQAWGHGPTSGGPRHMRMRLDSEGSLEVQLCTLDRRDCKEVASYRHYLNVVYPTREGRNNLYKFLSDVFNDQPHDPGWLGCKAWQNPTTTCKYAVTNISIESNREIPVFTDPASKCYALNARGGAPAALALGGGASSAVALGGGEDPASPDVQTSPAIFVFSVPLLLLAGLVWRLLNEGGGGVRSARHSCSSSGGGGSGDKLAPLKAKVRDIEER